MNATMLKPGEPVMVARLLKPVGLAGRVKAKSWSDAPDRFRVGTAFWVLAEPPVRVTVAEVAQAPNGMLTLRFEGRTSIEAVEAWRGCCLAVEESERAPLADGSFYHDELRGMAVVTAAGVPVGTVRDIWSSGPNDLLAVDCEDGERLLPMVRAFVVHVDRVGRRITVRPPNGWMDDVAV